MKRQHFIYIPGLGDGAEEARIRLLNTWSWRRGVSVEHVRMNWSDSNDSFQDKLSRVVDAIKSSPQDATLTLVGESAGGATALTIFQEHSDVIHNLVTICGKNHNAGNVGTSYYAKNPSFREAMLSADKAAQKLTTNHKAHILTIYSTFDHVVTPANSIITGAQRFKIFIPGHALSIAFTILCLFRVIRRT